MAKCKWCEKSGLFLSVDSDGLCKTCSAEHTEFLRKRALDVQVAGKQAMQTRSWKARANACDSLIEKALEILPFEEKGVRIMDPPVRKMIADAAELKEEVVVQHVVEEGGKILTRAGLKPTARAKRTEAAKLVALVDEARNVYDVDAPELDRLEHRARDFMHKAELEGFLGAAEKAEFKGNTKKALDQYLEALYFLKTDGVDDALQAEHIEELEAKVQKLRGAE